MRTRNPLFQFQGFQLFKAGLDDVWLADLWTGMDPHHVATTPATFWTTHTPGIESYLLRDPQGWLFFARVQRHNLIARRVPSDKPRTWAAVELHIQFGPCEGERYLSPELVRPPTSREIGAMKTIESARVIFGLVQGLKWLELALSGAGVSALFFESENPQLLRFSQKRLGFRTEGKRLLKWLIPSPVDVEKTGTDS